MHDNSSVYLRPGELYFGTGAREVVTILGSCVAVTLWDRVRLCGGMCHIVLPGDQRDSYDWRYADCAVEEFASRVHQAGGRADEYIVGLFGGGNMFPGVEATAKFAVGQRNVECVRGLLAAAGFRVARCDVGGSAYRHLRLDLRSGEIILKVNDVCGFGGR